MDNRSLQRKLLLMLLLDNTFHHNNTNSISQHFMRFEEYRFILLREFHNSPILTKPLHILTSLEMIKSLKHNHMIVNDDYLPAFWQTPLHKSFDWLYFPTSSDEASHKPNHLPLLQCKPAQQHEQLSQIHSQIQDCSLSCSPQACRKSHIDQEQWNRGQQALVPV